MRRLVIACCCALLALKVNFEYKEKKNGFDRLFTKQKGFVMIFRTKVVAIMGIAGEAHALQSIVGLMGEICLPLELGITDNPMIRPVRWRTLRPKVT